MGQKTCISFSTRTRNDKSRTIRILLGTANLFYDLNGNMTSDGTHTYTWDARNRLTQMDLGNTASFAYDAFGRRTSKSILSTQTGFLYDGANAVQELSGTTVTATSLSGGIDEVFQRMDSAGARSYLTDALGSTLALTDSTGAVQTQYTFEPFGNTTASGAATTNSSAYTGRELDATGMYYYRARYYNPSLQRFISEDPLGYAGGSVNFYEYAHNNPVDFRDPLGLAGCDQGCRDQIAVLQDLFPNSKPYNPETNSLIIYEDYETVQQTLQAAGYQEPPQVGLIGQWNPFLYFDPLFHAGGDEFRLGGEFGSFHFREQYPFPPIPQSDYTYTHPGAMGGEEDDLGPVPP